MQADHPRESRSASPRLPCKPGNVENLGPVRSAHPEHLVDAFSKLVKTEIRLAQVLLGRFHAILSRGRRTGSERLMPGVPHSGPIIWMHHIEPGVTACLSLRLTGQFSPLPDVEVAPRSIDRPNDDLRLRARRLYRRPA